MKTWLIILMMAASTPTLAGMSAELAKPVQKPPSALLDFPIRKGAMIEIESYDAATRTYSVRLTREDAVGPNIAAIEDMQKALGRPKLAELKRNPKQIVGNVYTLDRNLKLLSEKGAALRRAPRPSAPPSGADGK